MLKTRARHRYHLPSPGQLPHAPSPSLQLVPWGGGSRAEPSWGRGSQTPVFSVASPLSSAALMFVLACDFFNSFHTPQSLGPFRHPILVQFRTSIVATLTPSAGQLCPTSRSSPPRPISTSLPRPLSASAPLALPSKVSPSGSHLPRSSLARASLGPPGQCPAAAASGPVPPALRPPSLRGQRHPPSPEQLKVSVTSEGSAGGGERRGKPRKGRRRSLDVAAPAAAGAWQGLGCPPARPLPKVPPIRCARAAAGKVSPKARRGITGGFISLCAGGAGAGSRRRGWGPRDWGSSQGQGERHKGCTALGSPSPWPNFGRGACALGQPARCAENLGVWAEPGLGVSLAAFSSRPGPQGGIPKLPGGGGRPSRARGPRCPQQLRALPRMPLALAGRGPAGHPLPLRSFQRPAKVGFGASSLLFPLLSPFSLLFTLF